MKKVLGIFVLLQLIACTHTSPLVENADISEVVKISTKSEYALFGVAYASQIQKVFDAKGNIVIDDPVAIATKSAILPEGKYEIVLRCDSSAFFMFRTIVLDTEKGNEYVLQCIEGRVRDDAVATLVETNRLVGL